MFNASTADYCQTPTDIAARLFEVSYAHSAQISDNILETV